MTDASAIYPSQPAYNNQTPTSRQTTTASITTTCIVAHSTDYALHVSTRSLLLRHGAKKRHRQAPGRLQHDRTKVLSDDTAIPTSQEHARTASQERIR
jgi:ABC-type nitrate/sulfonate/bicarbonate transport system ATPase subunit